MDIIGHEAAAPGPLPSRSREALGPEIVLAENWLKKFVVMYKRVGGPKIRILIAEGPKN